MVSTCFCVLALFLKVALLPEQIQVCVIKIAGSQKADGDGMFVEERIAMVTSKDLETK